MDIFNKARSEIIIIDNYAGKELLDILRNINKKIIIVSKNIDEVLKKKYEGQYSNVTFINNDSFHDRFIILDRVKLYSCGGSVYMNAGAYNSDISSVLRLMNLVIMSICVDC